MLTPAFAVVLHVVLQCPSTDAYVGTGSYVYKRFFTKLEAESCAAEFNNDEDYESWAEVVMGPYKEGEDKRPIARNALEAYYDYHASMENCPDWAK